MGMKAITRIVRGTGGHWVGDGFPVHTMFSYHDDMGAEISPFLLLDYAGPARFEPSDGPPRGVGEHPHRGFETVTIVYDGAVEHGDNAGNAGKIGPGDVQWMTAGRGILHKEYHGVEFTKMGGTLEMVQLWVNLPARDKMTAPRYQEILGKNIPAVTLDNGAGRVRVIAGHYGGVTGAAKTFTPVDLWDIRLNAGRTLVLEIPDGRAASLLVLKGAVSINGGETFSAKELAVFARAGQTVSLAVSEDATLLLMSGEPIDEPIAGHGPFVMNTPEEIRQAMDDYRAGRF